MEDFVEPVREDLEEGYSRFQVVEEMLVAGAYPLAEEEIDFTGNIVEAAKEYYHLGFNVLPLKRGEKKPPGFWKQNQVARLPERLIDESFENANLGVITGRLSRNLFVLDCDSEEKFEEYLEKLSAMDLAKWVVKTSRGGHFWFLGKDGVVANKGMDECEIRGENLIVVAPPSVNGETGFLYHWISKSGDLPPAVGYEVLHELFPGIEVRFNADLPSEAHVVLELGHVSGFKSNSEAEYTAIRSLIVAGYSDAQIVRIFNRYEPPHYQSWECDEDRLIQYMIRPAREKCTMRAKRDMEFIEKARNWVYEQPWRGVAGSTDRKMLLACLRRAKHENERCFRASDRELAELANCSKGTVPVSIQRLIDRGLLVPYPAQSKWEASKYGFRGEFIAHLSEIPLLEEDKIGRLQEHDVWRNGALGNTGLEIYSYLLRSSIRRTAEEIAGAIGKITDTVNRRLKPLKDFELVIQTEDGYMASSVDRKRLDVIAEEFGAYGRQARKKAGFVRERESYSHRRAVPPPQVG